MDAKEILMMVRVEAKIRRLQMKNMYTQSLTLSLTHNEWIRPSSIRNMTDIQK